MSNSFSKEDKKKYMLKRHIKNHLFEYIVDFVGTILLTILLLYLCKAEEFVYGIVLSVAYATGKIIYSISCYKKEYVDIDIK